MGDHCMTNGMSRRVAIGTGAVVAASAATMAAGAGRAVAAPAGAAPYPAAPAAPPTVEANGPRRVQRVYDRQKERAGGRWHSHIATLNPDATATELVADDADF